MKSRPIGYSLFFALLLGTFSAAAASRADSASSQTIQTQESLNSDVFVFLPFTIKLEQQVTPTPQQILNGDFELGPEHWLEYSEQGWPLILPVDYLPISPHSGSWVAWLGGDDNELAALWQNVTIPQNNPHLSYWLWIASEDLCGYDIGGVGINSDVVLDAYWLCSDNDTNGWIQRSLDLNDFAGQTVDLVFLVETDSSLNSNMFIDDVSFTGALLTLEESPADGIDNRFDETAKDSILVQKGPIPSSDTNGYYSLKLLRENLPASARSEDK